MGGLLRPPEKKVGTISTDEIKLLDSLKIQKNLDAAGLTLESIRSSKSIKVV